MSIDCIFHHCEYHCDYADNDFGDHEEDDNDDGDNYIDGDDDDLVRTWMMEAAATAHSGVRQTSGSL